MQRRLSRARRPPPLLLGSRPPKQRPETPAPRRLVKPPQVPRNQLQQPPLLSQTPPLLQQLIDSLLLAHLPSAPTIAATPALLDQFTQLPPALVTRWVELDKYEVDSGNTIVVLLAAWYDAQTELPSVMDVLQLRKQLSALVPLAALSPCFHQQTLRNLPWWRRPEPGLGMDTTLAHMLVRLAKPCEALRNWWQETAAGGSVAKRANPCKTHTYTVTAEQLRQLWKDKQLPLPSFYYAGYVLGVNLYLEPESDGGEGEPWLVGLRLLSHWPEAIEDYCDNRPADAIMCCFRLSLPHAGSAFKHTMKYWLPGWGLRPTVKATFKSLRDLVPDQSTTLTLTCEIKGWYEAVSE